MTHRWHFYDPVLLTDQEIFLNPKEMRLPDLEKNITISETTAADGRSILSEGVQKIQTLGFSGTTLTLAQADFLTVLYEKEYQVRLTDDFDREWWIYIYKFTQTRPKSRPSHPELHTYTLDAYILDWP